MKRFCVLPAVVVTLLCAAVASAPPAVDSSIASGDERVVWVLPSRGPVPYDLPFEFDVEHSKNGKTGQVLGADSISLLMR